MRRIIDALILSIIIIMSTRRIVHVAVLKTSAIFGLVYAILGLVFAPLVAIGMLGGNGSPILYLFIGIVVIPLLYGVMGFVISAITIGLFNGIAPRLGGIEVDVE